MIRELTFWMTPFTGLGSIGDAIARIKSLTPARWHPNVLIPTHFGPWSQAECRQSLPADLRCSSPDDFLAIRSAFEAEGIGIGAWGVPVAIVDSRQPDRNIPQLAAGYAAAAGYYVSNREPGEFWTLGDNPAAEDDWWTQFWNALPDQPALDGNVAVTVIPNQWGMSNCQQSLPNMAAATNALCLEVYEGLQTEAQYHGSHLWPAEGVDAIRKTGVNANLVPILALANLDSQLRQAARIGHGQVQAWAI